MIKTYKLTARMNNAHIVLEGKSGNKVIYDFTDGNVVTNTPARIVLYSKYDQDLLEESEAFKAKMIVLEKVEITEEEKKAAEKAKKEAEKKAEAVTPAIEEAEETEDVKKSKAESITSVTEAINYCAEEWGEIVKTSRQAKECAQAHGTDFPNLKTRGNSL